ncbi:MAG: hypothetical protein DHS20C17_32480 [Cyclobacteriaceae bacterium]|nr:MAG: hypothetical protein DHS20C17_32480 [Cyclobacteriaceae bacterium]
MSKRCLILYFCYPITIVFLLNCAPDNRKSSINSIEQVVDSGEVNFRTIRPVFSEFQVDCSIRALEVINRDQVWFAGSAATYGYTTDGGQNWVIDSITNIGSGLEFRSIAVTDSAVFLLSVASPAYLLRSIDRGAHWEVVYHEDHPDTFYDSMKFWDNESGIAMGDPVDGCLSIILTRDGGKSWHKLPCSRLPATHLGEAAFAASNSNISVFGDNVWLVTGGTKARVFRSADRGDSWEVFDTPVVQGGKMTGIFSVDFYNDQSGIIFGGDWENKSLNTTNKAHTKDGGKTWELLADGSYPGYRSCVRYVPGSSGKGIFAVGIPGISYSGDGGGSWQHLEMEDFYTISLALNEKLGWLAGKNKIAKMEW